MAEAEYLIGLAQIALGLAGFTGVVIAFGNRPSEWTDADRTRFFLLLTSSIGAIFNTLLPLSINALGLEAPLLWQVSSLITALCFIAISLFYYLRLHGLRKRKEDNDVSYPLTAFLSAGSLTTIVVQLLNARGAFRAPFGIFLTGLLWGLFVPAVQFGRMVYVHFVRKPVSKEEPTAAAEAVEQRVLEDKGTPAAEIKEDERHAASAETVVSAGKRESSQSRS
jgi:hypothetical protein